VPKISINGHQIERVYKKEVLGIVIDDRLSWNRQNEEQCNNNININLFRGGSSFLDDRFTRSTQPLGGSGSMPPGKFLKFGPLKQHFLRSGVTL
jgi:hypothetical protein